MNATEPSKSGFEVPTKPKKGKATCRIHFPPEWGEARDRSIARDFASTRMLTAPGNIHLDKLWDLPEPLDNSAVAGI